MIKKGRHFEPWGLTHIGRRGEDNSQHKLTKDDVLEIKALYGDGITQKAISDYFGVCTSTVWSIIHRQKWGWL
jgi:hypothetical protein